DGSRPLLTCCPGTPRFAQLGDTYFCALPGSGFLDFSSSLGRWRSTRGLGFQKAIELAEAVAAPVDVDQVDVVEQPVEDRRGEDLVTGEDLGPVAHGLVAGQDDRAFLVAGAHEAEEEVGLVAVEGPEADLVHD